MIGLFGFSAGARRLPNSALRASPKIVMFALSPERAKKLQKTQRPKRHRRRLLETAPGGFGQKEPIAIHGAIARSARCTARAARGEHVRRALPARASGAGGAAQESGLLTRLSDDALTTPVY